MNSSSLFQMAKVHPQAQIASPSYFTSKQEVFTLWMKSLIPGRRGCTVFDCHGQIVYRVDNYDRTCSDQVCVMDSRGKVLFTLLKKKFKLAQCWEGHKCDGTEESQRRPWFQARGVVPFLRRFRSSCEAFVGLEANPQQICTIESCGSCKYGCKIVDQFGKLVAEVKRKRATGGVVLGEDVLTMVVEPCVDHSLVMGLFVVYSLINHRL